MHKGRLEAFSDGVIAIILTIMVLEMKVPHGAEFEDLKPIAPVFLSYILSFIYIGIYWNNHHHLLQATQKVSGPVLWANLHLLFWLSLTPFATAWMGENHFAAGPVALYGVVLFFAGVAYYILSQTLLRLHSHDSALKRAIGSDFKGKISVIVYAIAIALSFYSPWSAYTLYMLVAAIWFVPDRRIERVIG